MLPRRDRLKTQFIEDDLNKRYVNYVRVISCDGVFTGYITVKMDCAKKSTTLEQTSNKTCDVGNIHELKAIVKFITKLQSFSEPTIHFC